MEIREIRDIRDAFADLNFLRKKFNLPTYILYSYGGNWVKKNSNSYPYTSITESPTGD